MPSVARDRTPDDRSPQSPFTGRALTIIGLVTVASVYVASLLFLPNLRQPDRLVPYTALIAVFGLSVSFDLPAGSPLWQRIVLVLIRGGLAFATCSYSGGSIGLVPALYFIVVPSSYFDLPFVLAGAFTLLCTGLMFLGFLVGRSLSDALSMLLPYTGGMAFFAAASTALVQQARERERAEGLLSDLEAAHQKLREYANQVEALAVAEERNRLAREIHDSLGHYLTAITRQLEVAGKLVDQQPDRAAESIAKAEELARESLGEVRRSVAALRTSPVDAAALEEAIGSLVDDVRAGGISASYATLGDGYPLSTAQKLALYRAAQEGLTNVCKHAKASACQIELAYEPDQVTLTIVDNGIGQRGTPESGFGLLGLRERLALLGGSLEAGDRPEGGFCLRVVVPHSEAVGDE
jgi:signal transduction histidine kinase